MVTRTLLNADVNDKQIKNCRDLLRDSDTSASNVQALTQKKDCSLLGWPHSTL
jgi:hypothetical protein